MINARFLDSSNSSLNGVQPGYAPVISDVSPLTAFTVPKSKALKLDLLQTWGLRVFFVGATSSFTMKLNNTAVTNDDIDGGSAMTVSAGGAIVGNNPGGGFFGPAKKQLVSGSTVEFSNLTVHTNGISVFLHPRYFSDEVGRIQLTIYPGTINLRYQSDASTWTNIGVDTSVVTNTSSTIKIVLGENEIEFWHNTTKFKTIALTYKARLVNEAGTAVDANAGTLTLASDGTAYAGAMIPNATDLVYTTGSVLGTYNVEIENQHGVKVLQKVVVSDASGSGSSVLPISNNLIPNANLNNNTSVGWWGTYKSGIIIGAVVVVVAIVGFALIKKLFS